MAHIDSLSDADFLRFVVDASRADQSAVLRPAVLERIETIAD